MQRRVTRFGALVIAAVTLALAMLLALPLPGAWAASLPRPLASSVPLPRPGESSEGGAVFVGQPDQEIPPAGTGPAQQAIAALDASARQQVHVFGGSLYSRVVITNPNGLSGITDYQSANFSQRVISQAPGRVELEIRSTRILDSRAPFPVDPASLPPDMADWLAPRAAWIQSDDPVIVALAQQLAQGATQQAQVVDAVLAAVRARVNYDLAGPRDASSVLAQGRAYCVGYANLTIALLRALGIPARSQYGGVGNWDGWGAPVEGGRHVWVDVYYPDLGWVASDPQATSNFIDTAHIVGFIDQCGQPGTVVERIAADGSLSTKDAGYLYSVRTASASQSGLPMFAAHVPAWDRYPLVVQPTSVALNLPAQAPTGSVAVSLTTQDSVPATWRVETDAPWLIASASGSQAPANLRVEIDGRGMAPGTHVGTLQVVPAGAEAGASVRTVTVTVRIGEGVVSMQDPGPALPRDKRLCLPLVIRYR